MRRVIRFVVILLMLLTARQLGAQDLSISTNVIDYVNLGTFNLEASYGISKNWTVNASAKYNPFTYRPQGDELRSRQRSVSAGVRYWPWHIFSGWWLSTSLRYQEYNIGGYESLMTQEGDRFGGTFGGGYSYMLTPSLNLEFGLSFWTGYDIYTRYACATCGKKLGDGTKFFMLPSDILLGLTYIF